MASTRKRLSEFLYSNWYYDSRGSITLVRTGKQDFVLPTDTLRKCCPKLKGRLPDEAGSVTHVDLTGVDETAFEVVAQYFRTGELPELTIQNVIDIYCSASDLGIGKIEKKCWNHVFKLMSPEEQGLILFAEMEKSDLGQAEKMAIMEHLSRRFSRVVNTSSYLQLTTEQVKKLLSYPGIRRRHAPDVLYKAAMRWLHADCRVRQQFTEELLAVVGVGGNKSNDLSATLQLSICPTIAKGMPAAILKSAGDCEPMTMKSNAKHKKSVEVLPDNRAICKRLAECGTVHPNGVRRQSELTVGHCTKHPGQDVTENFVERTKHTHVNQPAYEEEHFGGDATVNDKINVLRRVEDRIKKLVNPGTSRARSKDGHRNIKVSAPTVLKMEKSRKASSRLPCASAKHQDKKGHHPMGRPNRSEGSRGEHYLDTCNQHGDHLRDSCGHCRCYKDTRNRYSDKKNHPVRVTSRTLTRAPPPSMEYVNAAVRPILKTSSSKATKKKSRINSRHRHHRIIVSDISPASLASSLSSEDPCGQGVRCKVDEKRHIRAKVGIRREI